MSNHPLSQSSANIDVGSGLNAWLESRNKFANQMMAESLLRCNVPNTGKPAFSSSMLMTPLGFFPPICFSPGILPACDTKAGLSAPRVPPPAPASPDNASENPARCQVDHSYTDLSLIAEDELDMLERPGPLPETGCKQEDLARQKIKDMATRFGPARDIKIRGGGTFPLKLMQVLNRRDMEDIIRWMPHGRAFKVIDPKACENDVLPRFFKQSKWTSFVRQLNLWGFKRLTHGEDAGAYYHECFLRGRRKLCMRMRRQRNKGLGFKPVPNPMNEPFLYNFPHLPELDPDRPISEPSTKTPASNATLLSKADQSSQPDELKVSSPRTEPTTELLQAAFDLATLFRNRN